MLEKCHLWKVTISVTKDSVEPKSKNVILASSSDSYGDIEGMIKEVTKGEWPGFMRKITIIEYIGEGYKDVPVTS